MSCKCINDEGTPALSCDGTCYDYGMINPESQKCAQEDGFTERQMEQISRIIRSALTGSSLMHNTWIDGFLKGFEEGKNYG